MAELFRVDPQPDIFSPELFLIQSQGMERMVGQRLSEEFRVFCNFRFLLPLDFISLIAEQLGVSETSETYSRMVLTWRLEELLRDIDDEVYLPLKLYLQGDNKPLKRFQLASRLAYIFDQYQVMRIDLLDHWQIDKFLTTNPSEKWQKGLWRKITNQEPDFVHRGVLFREVINLLTTQLGQDNLPKRISIIGLHTMPPIFLEFLGSLSKHMDIHLFLLSPCEKYWGDVLSKRGALLSTKNVNDREEASVVEGHSLLASLGAQGRDLQKMLVENIEFDLEFASYDDPSDLHPNNKLSLLHRIQSDLLQGEVQIRQSIIPTDSSCPDNSIRLVSCHSKLRELSVLKEHVRHFFTENMELELKDIVVMAPDIQDYSHLIPAVFYDIDHSIGDRSSRQQNEIFGAFLQFLTLFQGRYGWSELLDLLKLSVVSPQFDLEESDFDQIQQWVLGSGIRWGISEDMVGISPNQECGKVSWRAGLERLLMGYCIESDEFVDDILPYPDIEGAAGQPLGGVCQFIDVIENGHRSFAQNHSLQAWSQLLLDYCNLLFGEDFDPRVVELRSILSEISEIPEHFHSSEISFEVIFEWLHLAAKEKRSSSGFLSGQLTFCSMLPMRSIPFKVICILGMDEGVFPRQDNNDTFNLLNNGLPPRPGDRSMRADDRYQFLEAILAARDHLYISFVGQSSKTNEEIPPSVVVAEFLDLLEKDYGLRDPVVKHPPTFI